MNERKKCGWRVNWAGIGCVESILNRVVVKEFDLQLIGSIM
jgi:hypothetical protein